MRARDKRLYRDRDRQPSKLGERGRAGQAATRHLLGGLGGALQPAGERGGRAPAGATGPGAVWAKYRQGWPRLREQAIWEKGRR